MADLSLFSKTLNKKERIRYIIDQQYSYIRGYIPKWFSVVEVSREVLDYEEKVSLCNGVVTKDEVIEWSYFTKPPYVTRLERVFREKVVTETKYRDDISIDYHSYTESDFWKHYLAPRWLSFMIDMLSEQRQCNRSESISDNGIRKLRTYEYKFDGYGNWIECKVFVDGKPECLAIRKYKYI